MNLLNFTKTVAFTLLSVALAGCQFKDRTSKAGDIPVIDLSKSYPEKTVRLQDIADVEYIPLETSDDVLLGQRSSISAVSDKYILISDMKNIFIFDRTGKIVSHFNRQGNGPQEYVAAYHTLLDEKNEEVFVLDMVTHKFLVYSLTGEYKRLFNFSEDLYLTAIYNFDDENLLVFNDDRSFADNNYSEKPYLLLSKKDGSTVSEIDIRLPVRYTGRVVIEVDMGGGQKGTAASIIMTYKTQYYGQDFVIADMASDTVYRLDKNRTLTPVLVRTPSVHASSPPNVWSPALVTDKFMILFIITLDEQVHQQKKSIPAEYLMYEFETGQTCKVQLEDIDFGDTDWMASSFVIQLPKNTAAHLHDISMLKSRYENKKLKGKLEKLVATLDEDDNPVVVIYKFK